MFFSVEWTFDEYFSILEKRNSRKSAWVQNSTMFTSNKSHLFTSSHFQTAENLFYGAMYTDMLMHSLELGQAGNVFFVT